MKKNIYSILNNFSVNSIFIILILFSLTGYLSYSAAWFSEKLTLEKEIIYVKDSESSRKYFKHHKETLTNVERMIDEKILYLNSSEFSGFITAYTDSNIYYIREDGRFYIKGDIYSIENKANLTEQHKAHKVMWTPSPTNNKNYINSSDIEGESVDLGQSNSNNLIASDEFNSNFSELFSSEIANIKDYKQPDDIKNPIKSNKLKKSPIEVLSGDDNSCYIDLFGFNQPKVGFDEDCLKLSKEDKEKQVKLIMNELPDSFFIKYKAKNEKSKVYIFTDYTCHYCSKLHTKIDSFNEKGISVYYLMYPRSVGNKYANSDKTQTIVNNMSYAWCSADQQTALDKLYRSKTLDPVICDKESGRLDNPMRQHYILASMFDIIATPLIVSDKGKTTYGFKSVSKTIRSLGLL
jgi:hypothetical protein